MNKDKDYYLEEKRTEEFERRIANKKKKVMGDKFYCPDCREELTDVDSLTDHPDDYSMEYTCGNCGSIWYRNLPDGNGIIITRTGISDKFIVCTNCGNRMRKE